MFQFHCQPPLPSFTEYFFNDLPQAVDTVVPAAAAAAAAATEVLTVSLTELRFNLN